MSTERLDRIDELFDAALSLPATERRSYLERASDGDGALVDEVGSLLEAFDSPGPLDRLARSITGSAVSKLLHGSEPGERIGHFRLIEEIGQGGMGTVYLAERDDPELSQRVALKIVRVGLGSHELFKRFLAERQILARLSHPHIARFVDGGVNREGLPWYAMEYVEGTRLDDYCDSRRLDVDARIRILCQVCGAVEYAHVNLVVHRDLKPSNILVTLDGDVKLLDFGVAKLLEGDAIEGGVTSTRTGQRLFTPDYASPEQILGLPITTATDVFSLGVVAYELLCGRAPFERGGLSLIELAGTATQTVREAPSEALSRDWGSGNPGVPPEDVALVRGTDPPRLRRQLAGDLDTIVLKAVRPEPERRYATPGRLAEDFLRHLSSQPVRARPDTVGYRTTKFIRRHRSAVGAASLTALALVAGLAGSVWQARVARAQATAAQVERDRAEQVKGLLVGLFQSSNPDVSLGEDLTVREVLDRASVDGLVELEEQPLVRADLLRVIARVYQELGLLDESLRNAELALDALIGSGDTESLLFARTLATVATLRPSSGDFAGAEVAIDSALAVLRRTTQSPSHDLANELTALGYASNLMGGGERAVVLLEEAVEMLEALPGTKITLGLALHNLGSAYLTVGDLAAAEAALRESVAVRRKALAPNHPRLARSLDSLAEVLAMANKLEAADSAILEAIRIDTRAHGPDHMNTLNRQASRAMLLVQMGDPEAAEPVLRALVDSREAAPVGCRITRTCSRLSAVTERPANASNERWSSRRRSSAPSTSSRPCERRTWPSPWPSRGS